MAMGDTNGEQFGQEDQYESVNILWKEAIEWQKRYLKSLGIDVGEKTQGLEIPSSPIASNEVKNIENVSPLTVMNGRVYTGYKLKGGKRGGLGEVIGSFDRNLGTRLYVSETDLENIYETDAWEDLSSEELNTSSYYLGTMMHELFHSCQDLDLPLPIFETSVRYYIQNVLEKNDIFTSWHDCQEWNPLIEVYAKFVEKHGLKAHQLIFGKLQGEEKIQLLEELKNMFSNELLDSLSGVEFSYLKIK